jgi:phenylacetate-CoA ligase
MHEGESMRKFIYLLGTKIWNDDIFNKYNFLLESQYWDIDHLLEYQNNILKNLINTAYYGSKYYRDKFDNLKLKPNDVTCINDLKKIPILSKEELLRNREMIQIKKIGEKLFFAETSGSTGEPLVFYRDKQWDAWMRASLYRGYSWYNVNPWERNGFLWGYNFSIHKRIRVKILDELQNRFRLFSYNKEDIRKFLKKLEKAVLISGYSSMIYEVAKEINANYSSRYAIKMVMGASEKIYDSYQEEVKKAFGKKMINEYGAAEAGIIAFECPKGNMHINMETVIVEEEDNEVIITNLISNSFPIIRYKLGDYVELDNNIICDCGRKHLIIKEVLGRTGKVIYGLKERYPSLTLYYVFKNLAINKKLILNYVAVQKQIGYIDIYIERKISELEKGMLMVEYNKYFKDDLRLTLNDGVDYKQENAKKTDFISYIKK